MVTKNQIKLVASLQQKKYRSQHKLFVVEGAKTVTELLDAGFEPFKLFAEDSQNIRNLESVEIVSKAILKQMSSLVNPNGILGVFYIPDGRQTDTDDWMVALDAVRDPGNLGTIIRLCDWFGIRQLICSLDTVDCYNPKVLQATMGSIARVDITYLDLPKFLNETMLPVYGTFMDGEAIYTKQLPPKGILVMGNEGNGISEEINAIIKERITIPQFGENTTESLNVATATAIFLNEIRRG
ncbi:RNA methyltransferase [Flagellimonas sp. HMM57]|uniref:TrmH family RNA methyltransferase n=1 Tax=unclassified Flagellimonas TaxID=2644544 RepID=UPI0013D0B653|nr:MULTISPECIES: RNA methyltransferase [unclassified Flagellimonas]UII76754.1 RNA methyltransferase [Flagellimonas sp. HMM57]